MRLIKKFFLKKKFLVLIVLSLTTLGGFSFFLSQEKVPTPILSYDLSSSELGIAVSSPLGESGGLIVPASCPSDLHDAPAGYGNACTSSANNCSETNSGNIQCDGTCSAGPPADRTLCTACSNVTTTYNCSDMNGPQYDPNDGVFICNISDYAGTFSSTYCGGTFVSSTWGCTGGNCDCVSDGSCNASSPACESTTYGTDNCGTSCSQTGGACVCVSDGSCDATEPSCESTTTGVDNCGTACSKTGGTCGCTSDGSCNAITPACESTTYGTDNCGTSCSQTGGACVCTAPPTVNTYQCSIWNDATTCYGGTADFVTYCDGASGWENSTCATIACPVYGCTDSAANNYNAAATVDNGSCTYDVYGCMNPSASNYNPLATVDDGSCACAPSCGAWSVCSRSCGGGNQERFCRLSNCDDVGRNERECNKSPCGGFNWIEVAP